ncbi:MAG: DUF2723 domain-containing protein [Ignavibacteria bacterium]|nr:DUF2723 domain-containing protein [Ignavibacteria bacterium]
MKPERLFHIIIGFLVYMIAVTVLFLTVQPSLSFWDCGELSAASNLLQITHPPGAPLFLLVNKFTSLFPFAANIGFRINSLTVITSAFSVLFLYLVAVKLISFYRKDYGDNLTEQIITRIAAAIGAFSLAFGDTFWFNGTESNVFGFSTFLYTLMIWLLMVWYEKADEKGSDRILLLVAFIIGLSPGVHLMSVLAALSLGMLYVLRRYVTDEAIAIKTAKIAFVHILILIVVAFVLWAKETSNTPPTPAEFKSYDTSFKLILLVVSIAFMVFMRKKDVFNKSSFYWVFIVGLAFNLLAYPTMIKYTPHLISLIFGNNLSVNVFGLLVILLGLAYGVYWSKKNKKPLGTMIFASFIMLYLGFTTYGVIIIRANQSPPMNENEPKDFPTLVQYLSREQYGDFPTFKRRYSSEPQHRQIWQNYSSDLEYLLKWQINHQYNRYLFWNYIGRASWIQDDGVDFKKFFAIPFILGMLGLFYHFKRDWKLATVFLVMFIFMGYLICFYQDQQQMQPRERDYFYAGSFFIFSIWIALGVRGLVEEIQKLMKKNVPAVSYLVVGVIFLVVPVNMLRTNYYDHDRSKNWIPWDYAYNMLQSCPPNAVLFTNGDNDTFPLWYMQDVEGVRRDVRIANLSLINTNWYPKQLKNNTPYGSQKVKMTFTDDQLDKMQPTEWKPRNIDIPVPRKVYDDFGIKDTSVINKGKISFFMDATIGSDKVRGIRNQDVLMKDIIECAKWERPICYAITCDPSVRIGLDKYLKLQGLAYILTPKANEQGTDIDEEMMTKMLFADAPKISKEYQPGFLFRSFKEGVFLDENHLRTVDYNYRAAFLSLAEHYINDLNRPDLGKKTLDRMEEVIPYKNVEMGLSLLYTTAGMYMKSGDMEKFKFFLNECETKASLTLSSEKEKSYITREAQQILNGVRYLKDSLKIK